MSASLTIAWRELRSYATSPFAYVVAALYLAISGIFFVNDLSGLLQARLDGWMRDAATLTLFIAPLLSMRTIAEERRSGGLEVLLSAPVTDLAVVVGKYLGLLGFYTLLLVATLAYPFLLARWADPALGPLLSGYLGLELLGAASLGLGLLSSALGRQQLVAAVLALVSLLVFWQLDALAGLFGGEQRVLTYLATSVHIEPFLGGVIRPQDVVFYASVAVVAQFAAARVLASRRWL